ncbi:MAG: methionyl-tRNA formyltransferase [Clostridium sp.]|nr:methionyl-tRNA formyltransferase [Clostridium sp.]
MRLIFMGTAEFAVPSLRNLIRAGHDIPLVVTQPDRPAGRGRRLTPPPVKVLADEYELEFCQPESIRTQDFYETIQGIKPEAIIVVAYGKILPENILSVPPLGCINVHGSLLPPYRGAAPVQRALMAGETTVGVSTMYMDKNMDTGDIILQEKINLDGDEDYGETIATLAEVGAKLLLETLVQIEKGIAPRQPQDDSLATYAPPLTRADELIKWDTNNQNIRNQIRGLSPQPGAYTWWNKEKLKIFKTQIVDEVSPGLPGEVTKIVPDQGFVVRTGKGALMILEVQKQGKRRMLASEFLRGNDLREGDRLGRW